MLGKFLKLFICFALAIPLTSCNEKAFRNINKEPAINNSNEYISTTTANKVFEKINIQNKFTDSKDYTYPSNYTFTPNTLIENKLIGEADEFAKPGIKHLGIYDLSTERIEIIKQIDDTSAYKSLMILDFKDNNILFEEFDYEKRESKFYFGNIQDKNFKLLEHKTNVPQIHQSQGIIYEQDVIVSLYNEETNNYELNYYEIKENKKQTIEKSNTGFPIIVKKTLYYLTIDNDKKITQLISYDIVTNSKKVIFETKDEKMYLSGLTSNGETLALSMQYEEKAELYILENNELAKIYETTWIESLSFKGNIITWLGDSTIPERERMQYFALDINNNHELINEGGPIILSDNGIVWIEYRKPEAEIPKGESMTNQYSKIKYFKYK